MEVTDVNNKKVSKKEMQCKTKSIYKTIHVWRELILVQEQR